ncbi:MAG: hypothetical protein AAF799_47080 [Myxococcota bacterium]
MGTTTTVMGTGSAVLAMVLTIAGCSGESTEPAKAKPEAEPAKPDAEAPATPESAPLASVGAPTDTTAVALFQDARRVMYSDPAGAYDKAKQSYETEAKRDTLWVMGFAACRLGDGEKAEFVLARFDGDEDKDKLRSHCATKGLEI